MRLSPLSGALISILLAAPAAAAVCEGHQPVSYIYPPGGSTNVDNNTLVFVGEAWTDDGSTIELWEHNGPRIEVEETTLAAGRASVTVLRPTVELLHAAYRVEAVRPDASVVTLAIFAVGDDPGFDVPAVPAEAGFEPVWDTGEIPGCGTYARVEIRTRFEGRIMLLDVLDSDDGTPDGDDDDSAGPAPFFDPDALAGEVDTLLFEESHPDWFEIGRTNCIGNWPGAEPGASTQVRFAALEGTGGFSGWGAWHDVSIPLDFQPEPEPVDPEPVEEGCSMALRLSSTRAILAAAFMTLAALRRRWHHPPP